MSFLVTFLVKILVKLGAEAQSTSSSTAVMAEKELGRPFYLDLYGFPLANKTSALPRHCTALIIINIIINIYLLFLHDAILYSRHHTCPRRHCFG